VLYGGEDRTTAEVLAQWLGNPANAMNQASQQAWKVEQAASLGNQKFVVNTCATSLTEVPAQPNPIQRTEPKVGGMTTKILPPMKEKPLGGLRVAMFGCSVAERESKSIIKFILPAIRRLGGKPMVQIISEAKRANFAPSDKGLNIRITREIQKEVVGAEALLAQPEFESGNWEQVYTLQQSQNYLSIFVCPVDFSVQDSPRRSSSIGPSAPSPPAITKDLSTFVAGSSSKPNIQQKTAELPPVSQPPSSKGSLKNVQAQQQFPRTEHPSSLDHSGSSKSMTRGALIPVQKRILWVDDQPDNNRQEIAELGKFQIEVVTATSTEKALALIDSDAQSFDLVISDWQRLEVHLDTVSAGIHLLRQLHKRRPELPLIFYHNMGEDQQRIARREQALREGAFGEAVRPNELLKLVTSALASENSRTTLKY
jgi:CheY-like chemotaxis protein